MNYEWVRYQWHRLLAILAAIAGAVLLIFGWIGVSGASLTTEQIPYLASGAVGGLFALGLAATLWLSADLGDEFAKLDQIYQSLTGEQTNAEGENEELGPPGAERDADERSTGGRGRPLAARPPVGSKQ
jgi:hypothetical protein